MNRTIHRASASADHRLAARKKGRNASVRMAGGSRFAACTGNITTEHLALGTCLIPSGVDTRAGAQKRDLRGPKPFSIRPTLQRSSAKRSVHRSLRNPQDFRGIANHETLVVATGSALVVTTTAGAKRLRTQTTHSSV